MQFKDIVGQNQVKKNLIEAINMGRIPHAQFFIGAEGSGHLALAVAYIQYLFCKNKDETDSCGTCENCKQVGGFIHPDLRVCMPYKGANLEPLDFLPNWQVAFKLNPYMDLNFWAESIGFSDGNLNIPKKALHFIETHMRYQPMTDDYKVQFIWQPQFLGKEANSLLKVLEEPPERSLFILIGNHLDSVLTTIASRVQVVRVPPIENAELVNYALQNTELKEDEVKRICALSNGSLITFRELQNQEDNQYRAVLQKWFNTVLRKNYNSIILFSEHIDSKGREYQRAFLLYSLEILRSSLLWFNAKIEPVFSKEENDFIKQLSLHVDTIFVEQVLQKFSGELYALDRNINSKMVFTGISIFLIEEFGKKVLRNEATNGYKTSSTD